MEQTRQAAIQVINTILSQWRAKYIKDSTPMLDDEAYKNRWATLSIPGGKEYMARWRELSKITIDSPIVQFEAAVREKQAMVRQYGLAVADKKEILYDKLAAQSVHDWGLTKPGTPLQKGKRLHTALKGELGSHLPEDVGTKARNDVVADFTDVEQAIKTLQKRKPKVQ